MSFINKEKTGVAYLAGTVFIKGDSFRIRPRLQPLRVPEGTWLSAVVRIEIAGKNTALTEDLAKEIAKKIEIMVKGAEVSALQVDFDAKFSERPFYRHLLTGLGKLELPVSITAISSWCVYDGWLEGVPVSEAVPMFFRMGPERPIFINHLKKGDLRPECGRSIGISTDELFSGIPEGRRIYAFSPKPWTKDEVNKISEARK